MAGKAVANAAEETTKEEVAVRNGGFSTDELRELASFEDVQKLFASHGITVIDAADELGDGFMLVDNDDKPKFEGREMMLLSWHFAEGDYKREDGTKSEFVAVRFVSPEPTGGIGKYVLTDGGAVIYKDLKEYTVRTGIASAMYLKKGLRVSRYSNEHSDDNVTCYLDLSK